MAGAIVAGTVLGRLACWLLALAWKSLTAAEGRHRRQAPSGLVPVASSLARSSAVPPPAGDLDGPVDAGELQVAYLGVQRLVPLDATRLTW
jgi:hypothetical protein